MLRVLFKNEDWTRERHGVEIEPTSRELAHNLKNEEMPEKKLVVGLLYPIMSSCGFRWSTAGILSGKSSNCDTRARSAQARLSHFCRPPVPSYTD